MVGRIEVGTNWTTSFLKSYAAFMIVKTHTESRGSLANIINAWAEGALKNVDNMRTITGEGSILRVTLVGLIWTVADVSICLQVRQRLLPQGILSCPLGWQPLSLLLTRSLLRLGGCLLAITGGWVKMSLIVLSRLRIFHSFLTRLIKGSVLSL